MSKPNKKFSKAKGPNGEKVYTEDETRRRLINTAKGFGFEMEVRAILDRTDSLLRNCTNPQEREQIALFGILEIHKLLGAGGGLEVNGKKVI